jgi:hypothetical protein
LSTVIVPLVLGNTMLFHLLAGPSRLKLVIVALSQSACVPSGLTVPVGTVLNVTDPVKLVPTGGKNVGAVELVICPPKFHVMITGAPPRNIATQPKIAQSWKGGELKNFSRPGASTGNQQTRMPGRGLTGSHFAESANVLVGAAGFEPTTCSTQN